MGLEESNLRSRTLVIENEETSRSTIMKIEVIFGKENNLSSRIDAHCPLSCSSISIYHPELNYFVPLPQQEGFPTTIIPWTFL